MMRFAGGRLAVKVLVLVETENFSLVAGLQMRRIGSVASAECIAGFGGSCRIVDYAKPSRIPKTQACPCRFCRVIPSTWPFRIIWAASIPWMMAHAVASVRGRCMARKRRLM